MRLFLDAHISGPRIARALRERGHDVRAADEERELYGVADEQLLELATEEMRLMLTFDAIVAFVTPTPAPAFNPPRR